VIYTDSSNYYTKRVVVVKDRLVAQAKLNTFRTYPFHFTANGLCGLLGTMSLAADHDVEDENKKTMSNLLTGLERG
jgi:hypothetical protein